VAGGVGVVQHGEDVLGMNGPLLPPLQERPPQLPGHGDVINAFQVVIVLAGDQPDHILAEVQVGPLQSEYF